MNKKIYHFVSLILWLLTVVLIFFLSHQTGEESSNSSGSFLVFIESILKTEVSEGFLRTAAHFTEFMVLGLLTINLSYSYKGYLSPYKAVIFGSLYAVTDEIHQIFIPNRACELKDYLVDTAGVVIGVFIFTILHILLTKYKREREKLR